MSAAVRFAVLARAREYCQVSNLIGALPNSPAGRAQKKQLLDDRLHTMLHPEVDMFGLVGEAQVRPAVDTFFLETYPDSLRWESVLNGNVVVSAADEAIVNGEVPAVGEATEQPVDSATDQTAEQTCSPASGANSKHRANETMTAHFPPDDDTTVIFTLSRYWRDSETQKQLVVHATESISFEAVDGVWLARRFAYVVRPGSPQELDVPFALTVHVRFKDAVGRDAWMGAVGELADAVQRHEPGCLAFAAMHDDAGDPLKMMLFERYASRAAFEEHKKTAAFRTFLEKLNPIDREVDASYWRESRVVGFGGR